MQSEEQTNSRKADRRQFHIEKCLGRGGFGEVYLASMESAGGVRSKVAVKVLHEGLDPRSQAVQRLRDEGKLLGVLNHPSILRVTDLVLLDGRIALVTEYIPGLDLDACIASDTPPTTRALVEVIGRVADALHAAFHTTNRDGDRLALVHRDIKPSNIRIGIHGDVKLLDFGIAKGKAQREAKTQAKAIIGSYLYMAPERFEEDGASSAGDVYALGCSLYEGLAHKHLFGELELKRQYLMAMKPEKYNEFIDATFMGLSDQPPEVVKLLRAMLAHAEEDRPTAHDVSHLCDELAEDMSGDSLRRWCRSFEWPDPDEEPGDLDGRSITETTLISSPTTGGTGDEIQKVKNAVQAGQTFAFDKPQKKGATATPAPKARRRSVDTMMTPSTFDQAPSRGGIGVALAAGGGLLAIGMALVLALGVGGIALMSFGGDPVRTVTVAPMPDVDKPKPTGDEPDTAAPKATTDPEPTGDETSEEGTDGEGTDGEGTDGEGTDGDDPVVEVAPAPAPVPVAAPAPKPAPAPAPVVVAPRPRPAPSGGGTGTVVVKGSQTFELQKSGKVFAPGEVPSGTYEIWADFGSGKERAGSITVPAGQTVNIKCSKLRGNCVQAL